MKAFCRLAGQPLWVAVLQGSGVAVQDAASVQRSRVAFDPKARKFSLSWDGGYLSTTAGLLEALYGQDFMEKVGAGPAKTITVKSHSRQRVIGGASKAVGGYSYSVVKYPRRVSGGAAGGQEIKIEYGGSMWTARLGGSVQDFKQFLAGTGKPSKAFQFVTEKGGLYSSAS
jgi:hypothetical protein